MRLRVAVLALVAGCSSNSLPQGGAQALYAPCTEGTQVGDFSLWLSATAVDSTSGSSVFNGTMWDRPSVSDHQHPTMSEGACTLMAPDPAISCTPACTGTDACYADGTCAPNASAAASEPSS